MTRQSLFSGNFITSRLNVLPFLRRYCTAIIVIMCPDIAWPRVTFLTGRVLQAACREVNQKQCDVTLVCAITSCNRGVHLSLALILTSSWNVDHVVNITFGVWMQNTNFTVFTFEMFITASTLGNLVGVANLWLELGRYSASDISHGIVNYLASGSYHTSRLGFYVLLTVHLCIFL